MIRQSHGIRFKLTLWYAGALGLVLLGFGIALHVLVHASLEAQLHAHLEEHFAAVVAALGGEPHALAELDRHGAAGLFRVTDAGQLLHQSSDWDDRGPLNVPLYHGTKDMRTMASRDALELRLLADRIKIGTRQVDVFVAVSEDGAHQTLVTIRRFLLVGSICAVIVSLVGGYILADRLLNPIRDITTTAREITSEKLSDRVPVTNHEDELGQLATVINSLLARLEDSFGRLRQFTSDASHELRTPLTAIRAVGEAALRGQPDTTAFRRAIGSMLEEANRLTTLVDNLLALTRADADRSGTKKHRVVLNNLVSEVVDMMQIQAEEKGQTLSCEMTERVEALCDDVTMRHSLLNILDNAVLYTPANGEISVSLTTDHSGMAVIEVADNGPGIAPEHAKRVFDRFYRITSDKSERTGSGLGLAIARWAVEANGGTIELRSRPGSGSVFTIALQTKTK